MSAPPTAGEGTEGDDDEDDDDLRELLGMSARRAPATLVAGQVIDDTYRIEEELGAGGMGRVYRARDLHLDRDVAIKLHATCLAPDDESLRREATALARLAHPNVVTVYEIGTVGGHPWVAMECITGGTARTWLAAQTRMPAEILALYLAAGRGLAAAHAAGLVHRDFKPDNVLVGGDGRPRVADFGLARALVVPDPGAGLPSDPLVSRSAGTPAYMAPEQHAGAAIGPAADQFAFAVALWEALTGRRPYGDHVPAAAVAIPKPAARAMRGNVEAALRRALAIDPAKRWPSMDALLAELARDPARRRRQWMLGALASLALAGGGWMLARPRGAAAITCDAPTDELASLWSPARATALRAQFPTNGPRTATAIDAWASRLRIARRAACVATHVEHRQSEAALDRRTACLDRARGDLRATLAVLADAKVADLHALDAALALPHLEDCADPIALAGDDTPATPKAMLEVATTDAMNARARALRLAGQRPQALAAARLAVAYADQVGRPTASARARIELGTSMLDTGTLDGVLATFEEAARLAATGQDDGLVAQVWLTALDIVALRLEKPDEAARVLAVAEASVARVGKSERFEAYLAGAKADLALHRHDDAAAIPLFEQRIRAQVALYGPDDPDLARWLNQLATALSELHRNAEARTYLDRALAILEHRYGEQHPNVGVLLTTRGSIEYGDGDYAAARATYQRALAIKIATLGPRHPALVPTLVNLALVDSDLGDHDAALAQATRAMALIEGALPPTHPRRGAAGAILGRMQLEAGQWTAAASTLEQARQILEPLGEHPPLDETLSALALVRAHAGKLADARALAERAVVITTTGYGPSLQTALTIAQLGRALRTSGDPTGAAAAFARALVMARAVVGADHPAVAALEALADPP